MKLQSVKQMLNKNFETFSHESVRKTLEIRMCQDNRLKRVVLFRVTFFKRDDIKYRINGAITSFPSAIEGTFQPSLTRIEVKTNLLA